MTTLQHLTPQLGPLLVITTVLVFVLLLGAFAWRVPSFATGLGSLVAAWCIAPFIYLRKLARNLGAFGALGDGAYKDTDQFLLRRVIHACETALLLFATLILAATLVISVSHLIPPLEARQQLRGIRTDLSAALAEAQGVSSELSKLDADWNANKKRYVESVRLEDAKAIAAAESALQTVEARIERVRTLENAPNVLRAIVERDLGAEGASVTDVKAGTKVAIRRQLSAEVAAVVEPWVDAWGRLAEAKIQAAASGEAEIRARTQAKWGPLAAKKKELDANVQRLRAEEAAKAETASPHFDLALRTFLVGLGCFLVSVWIIGLALEWLSLAVNVAGDVKSLRSFLAPATLPVPARSEGVIRESLPGASVLHLET